MRMMLARGQRGLSMPSCASLSFGLHRLMYPSLATPQCITTMTFAGNRSSHEKIVCASNHRLPCSVARVRNHLPRLGRQNHHGAKWRHLCGLGFVVHQDLQSRPKRECESWPYLWWWNHNHTCGLLRINLPFYDRASDRETSCGLR